MTGLRKGDLLVGIQVDKNRKAGIRPKYQIKIS